MKINMINGVSYNVNLFDLKDRLSTDDGRFIEIRTEEGVFFINTDSIVSLEDLG